MIIYVTKQTFDRYKLKLPEDLTPPMNKLAQDVIEKESGDNICEWGGKLFYFDHRKCIQIVNFASKLTLFLVDIKIDDLPNIGDYIAKYLFDIYSTDKKMVKALEQEFKEHPVICFSKLKDRSIIATINTTQTRFADDGYRFYDFISDGILHTKEINHKVNFEWLFTAKNNGKTNYFYAGEKFREILLEKYKM
ncbi:MAG: hypothetical protein GX078_08555 [Clostridiales bacterium]|nr:hypothetical protein [Clostridiales bacterium]